MICEDCHRYGRIPLYDTDRGTDWGYGCRFGLDPEDCEERDDED